MSFAYLHECFPDPTKTFVYREVAQMVKMGMEPVIFSVREPSVEEKALMGAHDFQVQYLPGETELRALIERERDSFSRGQRRELSHWRAQKGDSNRVFEALWLGRELRRLGVRHVHAHFAGLAARTAWLVRRLWGIGYSFTGHADDIFSPEEKPISLAMLVRDARFIATETDYSRERLERDYPDAKEKTFRVFNGIHFDEAQVKAEEPEFTGTEEPPRIVSVGRLVEKKGFPDLLRVCALLRERGVKFGCDIVGGGPLDSALRAMVSELGLGDCVVMHGPQPQSQVRALLAGARVFALACQREGDGGSDNLPTVIMEAMVASLPVVSTKVAGIPEMVDDGETGSLVAEHDPASLADALAPFLTYADLADRLGTKGLERAKEKFSITNSAITLARLITSRAGVRAPAAAFTRDPALRIPFWRRCLGR